MKINYELEPQEFEAMCNCITSVFKIYAETEDKGRVTLEMMNTVLDKVDKLSEEQKAAAKSAPVVVKPAKKATKKSDKKESLGFLVNPAPKSEDDFKEVDDDEYI